MGYGSTAYNKRYTLRPLRGLGVPFARSATPPTLTPPTVCKPCKHFVFAYSGLQTVVYLERYVPLYH